MLYIYDDESRTTKTLIDAALLARERLEFEVISLSEEERVLTARFARDMDDGEAQTLAIAVSRNIPVLSDDAVAERIGSMEGLEIILTLDLLAEWENTKSIPTAELRAAVIGMYRRANYAPRRTHPRRSWYLSLIASANQDA